MRPIRIGIIGFGKIAEDQHVPSIRGNPRFELAATVSRQGKGVEGVPCFASHREMLEKVEGLEAVAAMTSLSTLGETMSRPPTSRMRPTSAGSSTVPAPTSARSPIAAARRRMLSSGWGEFNGTSMIRMPAA